MNRIIIYISILIFFCAGVIYFTSVPISSASYFGGYDASQEPFQESVDKMEPFAISLSRLQIQLLPLAKYEITAKIQSKHRYINGWSAKISPYDLALAWGKLVDKQMDKHIKYSQTSRFYLYRYKAETPYTQNYISEHSANTHIIPANKNIRKALFWVRKKQMVKMEGYLVNVSGNYKGYSVGWNSSTVRTDTGNGACEIMYVKRLHYKYKIYE
jgi:hypothetical protein